MAKERVVYDRKAKYKQLQDIYIRHGINLTRYSNHEARKLLDILDTANVQIRNRINSAKSIDTREQYQRVAREIRSITNETVEKLDKQLEIDFKGLAEEESKFVTNAMRTVGVTADFNIPAPAKIYAAASFKSYTENGHETFESYLNTLGDNVYKIWDTNVRAGYLAGLTAKEINHTVLGSTQNLTPGQMQALRKSLERNTRTMVASMAETARDSVYKKNSKLFSGYRYVSTLDSRTCLVCGELDGKVFETLDEAPELPAHHNCRCLYIPEIKGMEGFDEDDERASIDGPVSASMDYEDWLKTQPDDVVRDILGPTRFIGYQNGLSIESFVTDGRTLTIDQLIDKEGLQVFSQEEEIENKNSTPATLIYRHPDYSNPKISLEKAIELENDYLHKMTEETGNEHMSIITKNKHVIATYMGTPNNINLTQEELTIIKNNDIPNSIILLHSHTSDRGHSGPDLGTMCKYVSIESVRVITPNWSNYSASIGANGKRPNPINVMNNAFVEFENLLELPRYANMKENDVRWAALIRERNEILRKKYDWDIK